MRRLFLLFFLLLSLTVRAQSPYIPLNQDQYHLIDRYEIRQGRWADKFHSTVKPYNRQAVMQLIDTLENDPDGVLLSATDKFNIRYLRDDSWEWATPQPVRAMFPPVSVAFGRSSDSSATQPVILRYEEPGNSDRMLMRYFYRKKGDFYSVKNEDFDLHVSPVLHVGYGNDQALEKALISNTRGLEIRGSIGRRLGFYTFVTDNQTYYPKYIQDYGQLYKLNTGGGFAPGQGVAKLFNGSADYIEARGYITFNALKIINLQFGHDRNFFGNGIRSLLLSDNTASSLFLKFQTRFGKRFQYTNLFTELQNGQIVLDGTNFFPQKFTAMHHLSINISKRVNLGFFESEVYSRDKFDINYLNPVIFYRYVESARGSGDNAFVGMDVKVNAANHFLFYGQLMLDEFLIKELQAADGSWTNKFAAQLGAKYIDVLGIPNLDLQGEFNVARPYTYAHRSAQTNYTHYNQPLAHPLGANFLEGIGIVRYQRNRLTVNGTFSVMMKGTDSPDRNYGGNPTKNYEDRLRDYDNIIGQGRKTLITYTDLRLTYMLKHNLFLEGRYLNRIQDSQYIPDIYNSTVANFSIRWNAAYRNWIF
ncbi:hypothetical protein [Fibrella aquatica]|uniref:hypothetical protein n=1 Tax=Fibrella aquatica TaxID=3242487 RepID=UPI003521CFE2